MKGTIKKLLLVLIAVLVSTPGFAGGWQFGLGLNTGLSRLEGDLNGSQLSPLVSGHLKLFPWPYVGLMGELGYSVLGTSNNSNVNVLPNFKTTIIPIELSAIFNFRPFSKINPYLFAGGGGVAWNAKAGTTTLEKNFDSFLKTGGGLEFRLSPSFGINVAASFRFSLTDNFDQLPQGDENDQVIDMHAGFTYYFRKYPGDLDHDLIPDELDLMPEIAEDQDGYLDHDGVPEKNPSVLAMNSFDGPVGGANGGSPIVVHHLVKDVESGKDLPIKAMVYSNQALRIVAALYRPVGTRKWNVVRLEEREHNMYKGRIPGYAVTMEGLEYCVVAVDDELKGVGYAGLPSKPISIEVSRNGTPWRVVGGVVGAATIGTASYLVLRKQQP